MTADPNEPLSPEVLSMLRQIAGYGGHVPRDLKESYRLGLKHGHGEIASLDESRVALVAEHETRDAKWRELRGLEVFAFRPYSQGDSARRTELRHELGLGE